MSQRRRMDRLEKSIEDLKERRLIDPVIEDVVSLLKSIIEGLDIVEKKTTDLDDRLEKIGSELTSIQEKLK